MEKIGIEWIRAEMEKVPFGNSEFQNRTFTDGRESPERRRRHALLQLMKKTDALHACELRRERTDIDLEELEIALTAAATGSFPHRRLVIAKKEKEWQLNGEIQLINDALIEVETYMAILADLPPLADRAAFEAGEQSYWELRLLGDAARQIVERGTVGEGTQKALGEIGIKVSRSRETGLLQINGKTIGGTNDILLQRQANQISKGNNKPERMPEE